MRQVQVDVHNTSRNGQFYENCGVLCTVLPERNGQHLQQEVQDRKLQDWGVVWSDGYENSGVLC